MLASVPPNTAIPHILCVITTQRRCKGGISLSCGCLHYEGSGKKDYKHVSGKYILILSIQYFIDMIYYWRGKVTKKYGFKNYDILDKRQLNLLTWNMVKSLSNNAQVSASLLSYHKDSK